MASQTYTVHGSSVRLYVGDIRTSSAEVLVSSDDSDLSMGGGVSEVLLHLAGPGIRAEAQKQLPRRLGDVVVTSGGKSRARYILHGITVDYHRPIEEQLPGSPQDRKALIVRQIVGKALRLLPLLGCRSIAFPAVGAGVARIDFEIVVREMVATLVGILLDVPGAFTVEIWLFDRFGHRSDEDLFRSFQAYLERTLAMHVTDVTDRDAAPTVVPGVTNGNSRSLEPSSTARLRLIFDALRVLDVRRAAVEGELIEALATVDSKGAAIIADAYNRLQRIKDLRRGYEEDWDALLGHGPEWSGNAVFLSSTYEDLKDYRTELRKTIESLPLPFIGMEEFHPNEQMPVEFIRGELKKAGIYFGVLGMRYGSIDPATGLSMTELEYHQAVADRKKICVFLIADDAPINVQMVERSAEGFAKLVRLKGEIMASRTCGFFRTVDDLAKQAREALPKLHAERSGVP